MNTEEKLDLLKRVAECAPKDMFLEFRDTAGFQFLEFRGTYYKGKLEVMPVVQGSRHKLGYDSKDASLIVAMLDAMEAAGRYTMLELHRVSEYRLGFFGKMVMTTHWEYGATRAEAIAKAFCACFEEKPNGT